MTSTHYPAPAPSRPGESNEDYTSRLLITPPYNHRRNRQCSLAYHTECSERFNGGASGGGMCECPCHIHVARATDEDRERATGWAARHIADMHYLPVVTGGRIVETVRREVECGAASSIGELRECFVVAFGDQPSTAFLRGIVATMEEARRRVPGESGPFDPLDRWLALVADVEQALAAEHG